jgi:phenylalanyl-tRNA synthetase alpha chain
MVESDLKSTLEGLMDHLFGETEKRWSDDYFPFTSPSYELEIYHNNEWLEVLGCGVIHERVLDLSNRSDRRGWAFGLGLERLAMVLFGIPDIRLFWTNDERFHSQFEEGRITQFKSYSKYPPVYKDIAFWIPDDFVENDFFELARCVAGDIVERMEMIDEFTSPKKGKTSKCYRITYRCMDRSLTNEEIDALQFKLRDECPLLGCELR